MKRPSFRTFLQNFYSFFVYDSHRYDLQNRDQIAHLQKINKLFQVKMEMIRWLFNEKSGYCAANDDCVRGVEGSNCIDNQVFEFFFNFNYDSLVFFPYKQLNSAGELQAKMDRRLKLPYVVHRGKRLYYPADYSLEACIWAYRFLIEQDQILKGGCLEKAPHCYQSEQFKVENGDVLLDGGAAEGLFALDLIDTVSYAYIVEADAKWLPALKATFAPYSDKVKIVNKFLSDVVDESNTTIAELLSERKGSCFVKMDIEGAEPKVIKGSLEFLRSRNDIKLSCCSYHYNDDAIELATLFDEIGYQHEFSEGWFFFACYDMPKPPYFRHALIRAFKS